MAEIKDEKQYDAIKARIKEIKENKPIDDMRQLELDILYELIDRYEMDNFFF